MQATISGRWRQTICWVISTDSCCAPAALATAAACARSSAAPGTSQPAVKARTGALLSRAISASRAELSTPPERNIPYGTSLRWCSSTLLSSAPSRRSSASVSLISSAPPSGSAGRWRRSRTWPSRQVRVSPGSTRSMPAKIVSAPVVN